MGILKRWILPTVAGILLTSWAVAGLQQNRRIDENALKNAGKTKGATTIVSVDGGCAGVRNVRAGVIDATSQQYPLKMASLGVAAVVKYAKTGTKAHGYTDTGVNLIAKKAVAGVKSKSVKYGLANCWG